jgi:hypothetical protein
MIAYPENGRGAAGARYSVLPANLVDVQTLDGDIYYWADRPILAPAVITADGEPATVKYSPWLLNRPLLTTHRSMQADRVTFEVQCVSGDTLVPDMDRILRTAAIEGALCIFRIWNAAGEFAWREFHCQLTLDDKDNSKASLIGEQLSASSGQDSLTATYGENCNLTWKEKRCGATGDTECLYSFATCQVPERYQGVLVNFEPNLTDAVTSLPTTTINRRRRI